MSDMSTTKPVGKRSRPSSPAWATNSGYDPNNWFGAPVEEVWERSRRLMADDDD